MFIFSFFFIFFFKQKTAYEMRISDWSSDVCSSDLILRRGVEPRHRRAQPRERLGEQPGAAADIERGPAGKRGEALPVAAPMPDDLLADIAKPRRVEPMEHRRRAARVPTIGRERPEMRGFGRIDRGSGGGHRSTLG